MTKEQLDGLEGLCARASRAPLEIHRYDDDSGCINWQIQQVIAHEEEPAVVICNVRDDDNRRARADATALVELRNNAATLIAQARRCIELEERIAKVAETLELTAPPADSRPDAVLQWAAVKVRELLIA